MYTCNKSLEYQVVNVTKSLPTYKSVPEVRIFLTIHLSCNLNPSRGKLSITCLQVEQNWTFVLIHWPPNSIITDLI